MIEVFIRDHLHSYTLLVLMEDRSYMMTYSLVLHHILLRADLYLHLHNREVSQVYMSLYTVGVLRRLLIRHTPHLDSSYHLHMFRCIEADMSYYTPDCLRYHLPHHIVRFHFSHRLHSIAHRAYRVCHFHHFVQNTCMTKHVSHSLQDLLIISHRDQTYHFVWTDHFLVDCRFESHLLVSRIRHLWARDMLACYTLGIERGHSGMILHHHLLVS